MKLLNWFFLCCVLLATLVYSLILLDVPIPNWVRFYAADFLCMPIVLSICLLLIRKLKQKPNLQLPLFSILSLTAFYSLYFEVYLPPRSPRYTADNIDVFMYFSGAILFYIIQKQSTSTLEKIWFVNQCLLLYVALFSHPLIVEHLTHISTSMVVEKHNYYVILFKVSFELQESFDSCSSTVSNKHSFFLG